MSVVLAVAAEAAAVAPDEEPAERRRLFLIEGVAAWDALARLLAPFAIQQARLTEVRYNEAGDRFLARLEAEGLTLQRAETLCGRLRGLPIVTGVSFGWLGPAAIES